MFGCIEKEVESVNDGLGEDVYEITVLSSYCDIEVEGVDNGTTYDIGDVQVNSSEEVTFTIVNYGDLDINITGDITSSNTTQFIVTQPAVTTLGEDDETTFTVTYTPDTISSHSTLISIPSNDPDENPYTFTITGNGIAYPDIEVTGNFSFGNVYWGASKTVTYTITNNGIADLVLDTITSSNNNVFTVTQPSATTIASGNSTTFTVKFTPNGIATYSPTISIPSNDPDENPYTFTVTGTGIYNTSVSLTISPTSWSYSAAAGNYSSTSKTFTITNNSNYVIKITGQSVTYTVQKGGTVTASSATGVLSPDESITVILGASFVPVSGPPHGETLFAAANGKVTFTYNESKTQYISFNCGVAPTFPDLPDPEPDDPTDPVR